VAEHLTSKQIKDLVISPYEKDVRPRIRSGDLFFASGNYAISKMIKSFTNSPWSHVGVIFKLKEIDRVVLLEAVEDTGVRIIPVSKYLDDYKNNSKAYNGSLVIARPKDITSDMLQTIAKFGADELGRPYNTRELATIAARISLGIGRKKKNDRTYICSELVQACFQKAGKPFAFSNDGFISPEDIWVDEKVELVSRIL
jgi:uncharacterized protein YycO